MSDLQHPIQIADHPSQRALVEAYLNRVPVEPELGGSRIAELQAQIKALLIEKDAVIIAHYYTDPLIQALAEETGGTVSDSLEMARFGNNHRAQTLAVAGVKLWVRRPKYLLLKNVC